MSGQIAVGLKKGHKVDKREAPPKPGARKGVCFFGVFEKGEISPQGVLKRGKPHAKKTEN